MQAARGQLAEALEGRVDVEDHAVLEARQDQGVGADLESLGKTFLGGPQAVGDPGALDQEAQILLVVAQGVFDLPPLVHQALEVAFDLPLADHREGHQHHGPDQHQEGRVCCATPDRASR